MKQLYGDQYETRCRAGIEQCYNTLSNLQFNYNTQEVRALYYFAE